MPPRRTRTRVAWLVAAGAAVMVLALLGAGALLLREPDRQPVQSLRQERTPTSTGVRELAASGGGFAGVYARTSDGVGQVMVDTCGTDRWSGTGFLVSPTSVLTAHHVLAGASAVRLVFDGRPVNARVTSVDAVTDLALLTLDERVRGHVFELSGSLPQTGTQVAVIGFPMDEPRTLTVGTVSGLDRKVTTETGTYTGMLQTDTAINPGSSGGPVLDVGGQVVAVAGAMRTDAQGIGFAVPVSAAFRLLAADDLPAQELVACGG